MKIAVLSDIHSNAHALEAVLADTRARGVDAFVVLGNLVIDGPSSLPVMHTVQALTPWVIRGNREEYLLRIMDGRTPGETRATHQIASAWWTYEQLAPDDMAWMDELHAGLSLSWEGITVRMVHGSPFGVSDLLYQRDGDKVCRAARAVEENVLLYGHNHEPFCGMVEGKLSLNPGSIGGHLNQSVCAEYGLLTVSHGRAIGELLQVPYDFASFSRQMVESGLCAAAP